MIDIFIERAITFVCDCYFILLVYNSIMIIRMLMNNCANIILLCVIPFRIFACCCLEFRDSSFFKLNLFLLLFFIRKYIIFRNCFIL